MNNRMNTRDNLLCCMLLVYSVPVILVIYKYQNNGSISNIICDKENQTIVLGSMILMGICTILYETHRQDPISMTIIIGLLLGIYGVICVEECDNLHTYSAIIVFASILCFMYYHCRSKENNVLYYLLFIQLLLSVYIIFDTAHFLWLEALLIVIFAIFYLYLHLI